MRTRCVAGCCPHDSGLPGSAGAQSCPPDLPDAPVLERVAHLYACQLLSTYRIAGITGDSRQRVNRMLRKAGITVEPRGTGRPRAYPDEAARRLDELMAYLYLRSRLSSTHIAGLTGIAARTVRAVPMRTRGRCNREDRAVIPEADLAGLYVRAGLSADEVGRMLGVSRRVVLRSAHDAGLPVRIGGPPPRRGPSEIELIRALYADTMVRKVFSPRQFRPLPRRRRPAPSNVSYS